MGVERNRVWRRCGDDYLSSSAAFNRRRVWQNLSGPDSARSVDHRRKFAHRNLWNCDAIPLSAALNGRGRDLLLPTGSGRAEPGSSRYGGAFRFACRSLAPHQVASARFRDHLVLAYPLYEKARDLGIKVVQFHKGFPITRVKLEDLSPLDIQQAALDFPDLTFAVHHLALPYFEEVVYLASRFANVVLVLSGTMHLPMIAPWEFNNYMGRLLRDVGSDRLLWGSEAPLLGNPQPIIELFWNMQIEPELQSRFGYPEITEEDKRKILGENQARLFGVDIRRFKERAPAIGVKR